MYEGNHVLKKLTAAGVVAAAATGVLLIGSPANADNGDGGVLSGNRVSVPISIPVSVCGNAVGLLGLAGASCRGGAF